MVDRMTDDLAKPKFHAFAHICSSCCNALKMVSSSSTGAPSSSPAVSSGDSVSSICGANNGKSG